MTKAVIYCRVSTDEEIQVNALINQVEEAKQTVLKNKWVLVDQYVDEGKTGTTTRKRDEYNRLFKDMETDKFDIIVIKSQDRLMRSTKDWYLFIDRLVQNDKKLFFYIENKFYTPDDALITGIKAILAEDYSRELSKKINNAHSHRQRTKGNVVLTSNTWGYDKVGKEVVINQKEADVVRLMFELCVSGYGTRTIAKMLTNKGLFSRSGKAFSEGTIRKIIRNPLFKGTVIMNKVHYDFNKKKSIHNDVAEWIFKENAVPPIVDNETWQKANDIMDTRSQINYSKEFGNRVRGLKKGSTLLSSKIICGECGSTFWRTRYKRADGAMVINWTCSEYAKNGRKTPSTIYPASKKQIVTTNLGCDNIHINEENLNEVLLTLSKKLYKDKDNLFNQAFKILNEIISGECQNSIEEIQAKLNTVLKKREDLLDKYLDGIIEEEIYKKKDNSLLEESERLKQKINEETLRISKIESKEERLKIIRNEIKEIVNDDLALDFIQRHIKNLIIYPDKIIVKYDVFPESTVKIEKINYRKYNYICL